MASLSPYLASAEGQSLLKALDAVDQKPDELIARDETFWYQVQQSYTVSPNILNLNNGGVSPANEPTIFSLAIL